MFRSTAANNGTRTRGPSLIPHVIKAFQALLNMQVSNVCLLQIDSQRRHIVGLVACEALLPTGTWHCHT